MTVRALIRQLAQQAEALDQHVKVEMLDETGVIARGTIVEVSTHVVDGALVITGVTDPEIPHRQVRFLHGES